jgi:hypothetical protein
MKSEGIIDAGAQEENAPAPLATGLLGYQRECSAVLLATENSSGESRLPALSENGCLVGDGVECCSALNRLEREQQLTAREKQQSLGALEKYRALWAEVAPLNLVRDTAEQLLGRHGLRAADALQLAAALVWCNAHPKGKTLIGGDGKLLDAAEKEGFALIRL